MTQNRLVSLYQTNSATDSAATQKSIKDLCEKLGTFIHAPLTPAHASRVEKWAANDELVRVVANTLNNYPIWKMGPFECDIIPYWYGIALLSYSQHPAAISTLEYITHEMLASRHADSHLLLRNFRFYTFPHLASVTQKVVSYFEQLSRQCDAIVWASQIGLEAPGDDWSLFFELSTDGEKRFAFQLSPEEQEQRVELKVTVKIPPEGDGKCWEIEIYNMKSRCAGRFSSRPGGTVRRDSQIHALPHPASLVNFSETLMEIEKIIKKQFVQKIAYSHFTKGMKKKTALDKWVSTLPIGASQSALG